MHDFDIGTNTIFWDATVRRIWGISPDEMVTYETFLAGVHPEDQPSTTAAVAAAFDPDGPCHYDAEFRVVHRQSSDVRWVHADGEVVFDGRTAVRLVGTVQDITERKAAEERLRESEARLRRAASAASFGVHEFDPQRQAASWSPEMDRILGTSTGGGSIRMEEVLATLHPDDRDRIHAEMTAIQRRAGPYELECRIVRPDGEIRWIVDRGEAIGPVDPISGLVARITGTVSDIQARKEVEARLRESEQRFKHALAGSPITVFEHDAALRYQWLFNSKLGYSDTFCIGKTDHEIMEPAAAEVLTAFKQSVLSSGQSARQEVMAAAPGQPVEYFDLHAHPRRDEAGRVIGLTCVATDVTQQKRTVEALRQSEARLGTLVRAASPITWCCPPSGLHVEPQPEWMAFTGQSAEEMLGAGWTRAVHPEDLPAAAQRWQDAVARGVLFENEHRIRRHDGQWHWMRCQAVPIRDGSGEVVEWFGMMFDITERKESQERLQAAHDTFRHLVDRSPFGIYAVDADFRLVQVSDGAQKVFENVRPLIGRDFAEVLRTIWTEPFATEAIDRFRRTLATGEPYHAPSTIERRADVGATESYDWKIERVMLPDGRPGVVCHFYDLSERQRHEEHVRLLMREVNHRSKNLLGLIQAIARRTASSEAEDFALSFGERLQALAAAQDLLASSGWRAVPLADLVRAQITCFADPIEGTGRHHRATALAEPGGNASARDGAARAGDQRLQIRSALDRGRARRHRLGGRGGRRRSSRGSRSPGWRRADRPSPHRSATASAPP